MKQRLLGLVLLLCHPLLVLPQSSELSEAVRNHRYREALERLESADASPDNLLLKAACCRKLYRYNEALDIYEQLLQADPDNLSLQIAAAECASQAGNSRRSLHYWTMADSLSPGNSHIQTQRAVACYKNGNWAETIAQAETVFRTDSVPLLLRMTADAYLYSNNADSAICYYYKAIDRNPSDHIAVGKLGNIYYAAKFYDATIDLTASYLDTIDSLQVTVGQLNGMAHYSAGNYPEAIDRLQKNVQAGDSSYTTHYFLGMSYYARKLYYDAVQWLEKAYAQNNGDINLLYYYGTALSRTYDRKKGIKVLTEGVEKIAELNEMLYDFDNSFAGAHLRSGDYAQAVSYYQSALRRRPEQRMLLYHIAHTYDRMKEYRSAVDYYERFLKTAPKEMDLNKPMDGNDAEDMTSTEMLYRVARSRIVKLREELFFQSSRK